MMCEIHPKPRYEDRPEWYWPAMFSIKDIHEMYVEETKAEGSDIEPFKYDQFLKTLHSDFPHCRRMKEHSMFKCEVCCQLTAAMDCMKYGGKHTAQFNERDYNKFKKDKADHLQLANDARVKYQKHQRKARQRTTMVDGQLRYQYLCLIIDGITATTTEVPGYQRRRDLATKYGETSATCHLTGCKDATGRVYAAWNWENVPKDGNFVPNVLLRVLDIYKEENGYLPPVLYLQLDNTCRENKNKFVFSVLSYLVAMGVFKKIKVNFLVVGHTHEDIDQYFSVVSKGLVRNHPRTFPHMQRTVDLLREDTVQFVLQDYIDFKSWLHDHMDLSLGNLAADHQFRFAMAPKPVPAGWRSTGRPVMQSKVHAEIPAGYLPAVGSTPLLSLPADDDWPMLGEKRPLFCKSQPYAYASELAGDGPVTARPQVSTGASAPRGDAEVPLPTHRMNCSQYVKTLDKLAGIIRKLEDEHYFWDSRQEFTKEEMLAWWDGFFADQRQLMTVAALRKARALTENNNADLYRAFTRICLGSTVADASSAMEIVSMPPAVADAGTVTLPVTPTPAVIGGDMAAASLDDEADRYVGACSYESILANWRGPTSDHLEMLEVNDLSDYFKCLEQVPVQKPHVVLSCGDARDACSSWMGEGNVPKSGEARGKHQWVWVGEVQRVVAHSEDWKSATLDVHWYWQPVKGPGRQWLPCFRTPDMARNSFIRDREGLPPNLQCHINNPEYWYTSTVDIELSTVVGHFDSWQKVMPSRRQELAGDKEEKLYIPTHVQKHCIKRCKEMQAAAEQPRASSAAGGSSSSPQGAGDYQDLDARRSQGDDGVVAVAMPEDQTPMSIDACPHAGGDGGEPTLIEPHFPQVAAAARQKEKRRQKRQLRTQTAMDDVRALTTGDKRRRVNCTPAGESARPQCERPRRTATPFSPSMPMLGESAMDAFLG